MEIKMKRIFVLLVALVLALSLVSCDKDGGNNNNSNGNIEAVNDVTFYILYEDVKIELGADAKEVIEKLGTAKSESEMGACGDQGTVTKYVYDNFELFVLKLTAWYFISYQTISLYMRSLREKL